jgi:peptide/nickel transport system substrate-binding protein/microcin C transport system substrate-binding protein
MKPLLLPLFALILLAAPLGAADNAFAQFGNAKYQADFTHFDYVNPDAPKGGRIALSIVTQTSSFDKVNPFSLKGRSAPGLQELVFETLTFLSLDEPNTMYGLLADGISVAADQGSVTFHLNPAARFNNGDPLTAEDVRYSFATLTGKEASPRFRSAFADIAKLEVLDSQRVRFSFKRKNRNLVFVAGSLPIFSPKWGLNPDSSAPPFGEVRLQPPIASGPYRVERATGGLNIVFKRNPDYWAANLPIRRGMFNFNEVTFQLYKDADTQVAALRGGNFDFFAETRMRYWVAQYIGPRFDSGELVKLVVPHRNPPAFTGWVYNLRRPQFQDARVRAALDYAFDFEWVNDKILDGEFKRMTSLFNETPLEATGLPSAAELAILEPYRDKLPSAVFGPAVQQPQTQGQGGLGFRANLATAIDLFAQAGWTVQDGQLRNAQGTRFSIEMPGTRGQSPLNDPYEQALRQLGIDVRKTLVDAAVTRAKLNDFDFDYTSLSLRESRFPANELWRLFNSKAADTKGSENLAGVRSPILDELILRLQNATDESDYIATGRAIDRIVMHERYVMPWRYLVKHYLMFNRRLARPATLPTYYGANEWALSTWWDTAASPGAVR